jgi:hypothetical protein
LVKISKTSRHALLHGCPINFRMFVGVLREVEAPFYRIASPGWIAQNMKHSMPVITPFSSGGFCSLGTANGRRSVTIVADMLLSRIRRGGVTQGPAIPKQSGPQPPNQRQRWIEAITLNGAEQDDNPNGIAYPPEDATTGRRLEGWLNSERGPLAAVALRNSDARRTHSIRAMRHERPSTLLPSGGNPTSLMLAS